MFRALAIVIAICQHYLRHILLFLRLLPKGGQDKFIPVGQNVTRFIILAGTYLQI